MADGKKDNKYQEYLLHLQGWKVRKDSRVDPSDKSLDKSLWTVTKDEVEKYDTSPVRIALFGLGRIGMIHLQKIYSNPRTKLVYCVEPVAERRQYVRTAWFLNDVTFLDISDVDKVLEDPEIDAIVIGTPTYTHKELTIKSLKAKKAVLCEKPLAPDFDGTKECYELAEKMGVPLLTAFNRRFDPGFFDCRTRARAGEVGKIRVIKTCARDSPLPPIEYLKTSGGIFKDCACHDIDIILWVTGELPYQVFSQAHVYDDKIKEIDDFDTVGIMMKFPSGTLGIIDLSRNSSYGYDQRLEVFGLDGMLTGGNIRPNGVITENNKGTNQTPYFYSFASRFGEAYGQELEHFVDVMKGKEKIQITKMDSLKGFTVVLAAEKSARSGKSVYINWSDDGSGTLVDENEYKKSKSGSKSESKSKSDSKSESKTDAKSESKTDTKSESKTSAKSDSKTSAKSDSKTSAKSDSETSGKSDSETSAKSDSKTSGKSDSETSAKSDSKSKSVTKTDSKSESKADAKSESKSKSETKADSKSESKTESKSKSK